MDFLLLIGRVLFSLLFISSGFGHLKATEEMSQYAASKNVPLPKAAVFVSGIMILLGGVSVMLGLWVKIGALLLVIFLLPAALLIHNFWAIEDPEEYQNEQIHFMKDLALAGGAFVIWYLYMTADHIAWSLSNY